MLSILFILAAATQPPLPLQWAQFRRAGALSRVSETVDVATGGKRIGADFPYQLRFTKDALGEKPQIKWADSATCPAVRSVIASMTSIKMPSPAPYGVPGEQMMITVDGTGYSLTAPSSDNMGEITISSNVGSPLAAWIDASFKQLAPCWKTSAP
ncbi:hypothetical protein ACFSGX_13430 [Sphingomonas arantia]|uniref:Uncharacterized protein n=1 Tax=Sphingomonas arantia TaxID=1460676 RepID=A0ABW4TYG0_9SPHN